MPDALDPFLLFCGYHLGLDRRGRRRFQNAHDVARDLGVDVSAVHAALQRYGLDAERLLNLDFDLVGAQLDIQASPPGVDLLSIAQMHWELLQQAPEKRRDWAQEAEDAARENEAIFGRPRRG